MPALDRASRDYAAKNAPVVFLAVDYKENPKDLKAYLEQAKIDIAVPLDVDGRVTERYLVQGFPTTLVIDQTGIIRSKVVGAVDYEQIRAMIDPLLGAK